MTYTTEGPAPSGPSSIDRIDARDTIKRLALTEPIGAGVVRVMATQLDIALLALAGLSPDVHTARKAMKRTRGLLRLVRGSIGEAAYRAENDALRDAARLLAPARDATAKIETFDALLAAHPQALGIAEADAIRDTLTTDEQRQQALLTTDPNLLPSVIGVLAETRQRITAIPAAPATRPRHPSRATNTNRVGIQMVTVAAPSTPRPRSRRWWRGNRERRGSPGSDRPRSST